MKKLRELGQAIDLDLVGMGITVGATLAAAIGAFRVVWALSGWIVYWVGP